MEVVTCVQLESRTFYLFVFYVYHYYAYSHMFSVWENRAATIGDVLKLGAKKMVLVAADG
jgi:hypothetical protein